MRVLRARRASFSRVRRAATREFGRLLPALLALFGLSFGLAGEAGAQCSLAAGPTKLTCPDCQPTNPAQGFTTVAPFVGLYKNSAGADRLLVPMTWGWILYGLASPAYPSEMRVYDLRYAPDGPGIPHQDGQSFGPGYAMSADGQRILNSSALSNADTVVSVPNPLGEMSEFPFLPKGDTGLGLAKLAVQHKGGRYIAYGLFGAGTMFAADVTTLTRFSLSNPIPYDRSFSLGSTAQSLAIAEGVLKSYLYSFDAAGAVVVDVTNPGAAPNITEEFVRNSIPTGVFGLPANRFLLSVSAAVDPASGKLYVLGSFQDGQGVPSFSLVLYDPATTSATLVGKYTAPFEAGAPTFNASGGSGAVVVNPSTGDVWTFMWVRSASLGKFRLYATLARTFGSPIGLSAELSGPGGYLTGTAILFGGQTNAYAYFLDGAGPWAAGLSCQTGPVPATGSLSVTNASTGQPVASGATVFVGDTLTVNPSVTPTSAIQPITGWHLDLDYHADETTPVGLSLINHPDSTGQGDPPAFTLVGPCDPRAGGTPSTGNGCWASVVSNGDFASSAAGTTKALPVAFDAQNALNTTTLPLATFNVVWKVPAVKVQSLSALLNNGSATFSDGSEGHPVASGYKWYFGTNNTAPSAEALVQDNGCNGMASCSHSFAAGKGTYNAVLAAAYGNGYTNVSPLFTGTCGSGGTACFQVAVSDFVASFTAPSSAIVNSSLTVTNNSQIGAGVTGIGYSFNFCDASSGPCADPGSYQAVAGMGGPGTSGTITAPSTGGTWWLRIRATYNATSTAQWLPSAVSDPTAWPVAVAAPKPFITPTAGFDYCTFGGCPNSYTGVGGTPITVTLMQSGNTLQGIFSWSVSGAGASPASGSGSSFTFTPATAGSAIVSVTAGSSPLPDPIGFTIASPPPPPAPVIATSAVVGAGSPNRSASVSPTAGSTYNWTITNATITAGQGTNRITFTAGSVGIPINLAATETALSGLTSPQGFATVMVASAGSALQFYTLPPCRVIDTRTSSGFPSGYGSPSMAGGGAQRPFVLPGKCGIPAGAQAVSANATVWAPVTRGNMRVFPAGGATPNVSLLNWEAGILALANAGILQLGSGGDVTVQVDGTGTVDVIVDVNGYFQ